MGGGEEHAASLARVYEVDIYGDKGPAISQTITTTNSTWNGTSTFTWPNIYYYTYPSTIYLYQIKCPRTRCKTFNWLQLDTITPCRACGAKLKAVSQTADYEIEVG